MSSARSVAAGVSMAGGAPAKAIDFFNDLAPLVVLAPL
jgi:hypothetical protein